MVKPKKFGLLHLFHHFTVPLRQVINQVINLFALVIHHSHAKYSLKSLGSFTNVLVRVLKSCKRPTKYFYGNFLTIYQTPLKLTPKKPCLVKLRALTCKSTKK